MMFLQNSGKASACIVGLYNIIRNSNSQTIYTIITVVQTSSSLLLVAHLNFTPANRRFHNPLSNQKSYRNIHNVTENKKALDECFFYSLLFAIILRL